MCGQNTTGTIYTGQCTESFSIQYCYDATLSSDEQVYGLNGCLLVQRGFNASRLMQFHGVSCLNFEEEKCINKHVIQSLWLNLAYLDIRV